MSPETQKREVDVEKLLNLLSGWTQEHPSKEEFVKSFETIMKLVVKIEGQLIEKVNKKLLEADDKVAGMSKETRDSFEDAVEKARKNMESTVASFRERVKNIDTMFALVDGRFEEARSEHMKEMEEIAKQHDENKSQIIGMLPSVKTPENLRDSLESLPEGKKTSIQAIQDLPKLLQELSEKSSRVTGGLISKRIRFVDDETPTGTINAVNTVFTLSRAPETGSLKVYRGGARQRVTEDYTFSGKTITFTVAPVSGEILLVDFRY